MPNNLPVSGQYIPGGNPDTMNVRITEPATTPGQFTPYADGQLGLTFESGDKQYTIVKLDSGATSATPTGAVAANQLAFWKDKTNRIVTNDQRFALGGQTSNAARNFVAGVFRAALTPGTYGSVVCVLNKGHNIPVASDGSGGVGQTAIADGTAATARVTPVAVGTAPTYVPVGIMRDTPSGGNVNVDVDVPFL